MSWQLPLPQALRGLQPKRLFWKIFLSLWLAIATIALAVDWVVDALFQRELRAASELSIGYRAELASGLIAMSLSRDGVEATRQLFEDWAGKRPMPVMVVDERGRDLIDRPVSPMALAQARQLLREKPAATAVHDILAHDGDRYLLFVPLPLLPATPPSQHVYQTPESFTAELITLTLASLLFAAGLGWYLYQPIRHLHEANRRFAEGRLDTRIGPLIGHRSDEITDLARDFDDMAERVETTVEARTRLLYDVSHELRSPLSRMQVALALIRQNPQKGPEMLDRLAYEIDRLDRTLNETLALSRLESRSPVPEEECINLVALLEEIVNDAQFEAGFDSHRIELEADGNVLVKGRGELLRRAFENVIRNGMLHTPADASVHVRVAAPRCGRVCVSVRDRGPGIGEDQLSQVFEPFFRGRVATSGHGLGLSIVRRTIEAHGGTVSAINIPSGGLCINLELPVLALEPEAGQSPG